MKTKLAKIGYVANSFNTVLGDFISAGRLYEYIGGMCNPRKLIKYSNVPPIKEPNKKY